MMDTIPNSPVEAGLTTFRNFLPMSGKYIAVFEEFGEEIRLNQKSLEDRISNLKAQGIAAPVEMVALIELKRKNAAAEGGAE